MWKCTKCETMNQDAAATCLICHYEKRQVMLQEHKQQALIEVAQYEEDRNYQGALQLLRRIITENPGDPDLDKLYGEYEQMYVDDCIAASNSAVALGTRETLEEAIRSLSEAYQFLGANSQIADQIYRLQAMRTKSGKKKAPVEIILALVAIGLVLVLLLFVAVFAAMSNG